MDFPRPAPKIYVSCVCELRSTDEVVDDFCDIEEGPRGEDWLTFKCVLCGAVHTGTVYA